MKVLGIDGGFASIGISVMDLRPDEVLLHGVQVFRTEKSDRKLGVRSGDDMARRAREIAGALDDLVLIHQPGAIAIESPSWPRSAGVAAKMGVAFGVVFSIAAVRRLPLVMATPMDVKKAVVGVKTASKDEVIAAIEARFPAISWPRQRSLWEHAADAVGVVLACLDSDALQMARRIAS